MNLTLLGELPLSAFLGLFLAVLALVYIQFQRKVLRADQRFVGFRAGELARRLGLEPTRGDPACNLVLDNNAGQGTLDVKLEGQVGGVPLELVYHRSLERVSPLDATESQRQFDCRMVARARLTFPRFEVQHQLAGRPPILQLSQVMTGNPAVDAWCQVFTTDPVMARRLGEVLGAFVDFRGDGLHLIGDGQNVVALMRDDGPPLHAVVLGKAEAMAQGLTRLARAVGG